MSEESTLIFNAINENKDFNMAIWEQVDTSDPAQLKKVDQRGGFLSIDAYPQIKAATEIFGPMGLGFGLQDVDYKLVENVEASTTKKPNTKGMVMIFQCTFWYKIPGGDTIGQFPIVNSMLFEARNDCPKKLLTNSITKALSYLGFNYDVFSGRWDDDPYINRPDIPCPIWLRENFNRLLSHEHEGKKFFTEKQLTDVNTFQINAGWTLQSVKNFVETAIKRMNKASVPVPILLEEGDSSNGIQSDESQGTKSSEEETSEKEDNSNKEA